MAEFDNDGVARPYPDWAYGDGYASSKGVGAPLVIAGIVQFVVSLAIPKPDPDVISTGTPSELAAAGGDLAATILVPVAIIGLVLYFAFFRSRDPGGIWKIPVVLLPVALATSFFAIVGAAALNEGEQRRLAERSMAETFRHYVESDGRDAGPLRHSGATGEYGEIERVVLQFFGDFSGRTRRYEADVQALAGIFEPENSRAPARVHRHLHQRPAPGASGPAPPVAAREPERSHPPRRG